MKNIPVEIRTSSPWPARIDDMVQIEVTFTTSCLITKDDMQWLKDRCQELSKELDRRRVTYDL